MKNVIILFVGLVILLFMLFYIGIESLLRSLLNADLRWLFFAFALLPPHLSYKSMALENVAFAV